MTIAPPGHTLTVAHVMRTYGVHGGERQLGQLFASFSNPAFSHLFCFVYRDDRCAQYFGSIPDLRQEILLGVRARAFPSLLLELLMLALCLPVLQIRLLMTLRKNACRICVAHGLQGALVCWLAAIVMPGVRFVYMHRGTKSAQGKLAVFKLLYRPFDVVGGVSHASAASLQGLAEPGKLRVLENGIDGQDIDRRRLACAPKTTGAFVVCCVGRLMPGKGQHLLLRAFARFHASFPNSQLWIAGDGPDDESLRRLASELSLTDAVRFLGHSAEVVCLLAQSDAFVHASQSEGLSNAVLEAMMVGIPSVVVDAPGVSECHVQGESGFVVERSAEAIAEKLLQLAGDAALCARMGAAARQRACTHYSIAENCRRYDRLYQQLTGISECAA